MIKYVLKREDGSIVEGMSWSKKSHVEAWIRYYLNFNGLDWRVGSIFKAKGGNILEVVKNKTKKQVKWFDVEPAEIDEYNPEKENLKNLEN